MTPHLARLASTLCLALAAPLAMAQATPVGLWKTIDDETKQEKSQVRITAQEGVLSGTVEKLLNAAPGATAVCDKCTDERRGKPIVGMTILRQARPDGKGETWEGGDILDPSNGRVYKLRLKPIDDGRKLEVRGYLGPFYRNQVWLRVE